MADNSLLSIDHAERIFGGGRTLFGSSLPAVHAVQDVSLDVQKGETLGIVGESGCGKSTLARLIVGLDAPSSGTLRLDGRDLVADARKDARVFARKVQYVFQDPVASLNPRKTIRAILEAPLIHLLGLGRSARTAQLETLITAVNLAPEFLERYPHELSGGQAQRVGIARALAAKPRLLVLDEPVSALDVSVQAQVLNLLADVKDQFDLTYVFISHDLSVIESVSDRIAVMYFGRVVEIGPARALLAEPQHPYTQLLLKSAPAPGKRSLIPEDANTELPDPYNPPSGCAFRARCAVAAEMCKAERPALDPVAVNSSHAVACHFPHGTR